MRRQQIVGARFKANPLSPCGQSRHRPLDATVLFRAHLLDVSAGGQMVGRRFPPGAQRGVQRRLAAHCPGCVRLADVQTWQEGWTVTEHGRRPGAVRRPRPQAYLSFANDRHDSELRPKATGAPVRSRVGPSGRRRVRPPRVIRLAAATRRRRGVPYLHPAGSSLIVPGAHDLAAIQDSRRDAACRAEDLFVPRLVNDQGPSSYGRADKRRTLAAARPVRPTAGPGTARGSWRRPALVDGGKAALKRRAKRPRLTRARAFAVRVRVLQRARIRTRSPAPTGSARAPVGTSPGPVPAGSRHARTPAP